MAIVVSIVYQSGGGHTRIIAEAVAAGAGSIPGCEASLVEITGDRVVSGRWDDPEAMDRLDRSAAIVFGCPTYMGSASAIFKAFLERAFKPWLEQRWKDKVAAGFTNSASQSGDKLSTLIQLSVFAAQMGMIWVGVGDPPGNNWSGGSVDALNRLGSWLGLMSQSNGGPGSRSGSRRRGPANRRAIRSAGRRGHEPVERARRLSDRAAEGTVRRRAAFHLAEDAQNRLGRLPILDRGRGTDPFSGVETVAHLRQNGRITILFCGFEGRPLIVRLYGRGRVVEPGDDTWDDLIAEFPEYPGVRSVVVVGVDRVADSCGFAVPLYEYKGERSQLVAYAEKKGPEGMEKYKAQKNRASIDGIAGLRSAGGEK